MKKMSLIIGVAVVVIGALAYIITRSVVNPSTILVRSVEVSDSAITIRGDFMASALWYVGYKTEYRDGTLYLRIIGSNINFPSRRGDIDVSIPNTYGAIKSVYLQGGPEGGVMIWPENKTLRNPLP